MYLTVQDTANILETNYSTILRWLKELDIPVHTEPRPGMGGHHHRYVPFKIFLHRLIEEKYIPFKRIDNIDRKICRKTSFGKTANFDPSVRPEK